VDRTEKILTIIEDNPGIHVRGIIKESKFENGVVQYHLKKLEKQGKIKFDKRTRFKRFYTVDVDEEEFPIIANLRKKSKQNLLFAILSSTDPHFEDILKKIRKSPSTTSWNISGLVKDGIIEKMYTEGKTVYKIKDKKLLKKTLEKEFSKLFKDSLEHDEDAFLAL